MPTYLSCALLAFCLSSVPARADPICVTVLNDSAEIVHLCAPYPFITTCFVLGPNPLVVICVPEA